METNLTSVIGTMYFRETVVNCLVTREYGVELDVQHKGHVRKVTLPTRYVGDVGLFQVDQRADG